MGNINKYKMLWMVLLLLSIVSNAQATTPVTLSFGIVPQERPTRTVDLWTELIKEIERRSGYHIQLKTSQDISTFEHRLETGEFDLVYMNPYEYTVYHRTPGYQVFAREEKKLQPLIIVRRDSSIQKLSDLNGKTMAFVPSAFAATILPLAYLHQQGISVIPKFVDSHESVYLSIINGTYPAGGGIHRSFERMVPELRASLRVLWAIPPVTPHAIAAHPRVSHVVVEQLQRVLINLKHDVTGRKILKDHGFTGIIAAHDNDWDDIRALKIQ